MRITGFLAALAATALVVVAISLYQSARMSPAQAAAAAAAALPVARPAGPQPKVTVEPSTVHEFGNIQLGDTGRHTFTIKNEGQSDLELKAEYTTCKCTLSDMKDSVLAPGETLDVELEWTPKVPGVEFSQYARVRTNDPDRENVDLRVVGQVLEDVVLQPGTVWDVGSISEDADDLSETLGLVASQVSENFEVTGVRGDPENLEVRIEPLTVQEIVDSGSADPNGVPIKGGAKVYVKVRPGMAVGRFSEDLTLTTNLENTKSVKIAIAGTRPGPFSILGKGWRGNVSRLDLGKFPASKGKSVTLMMLVDPSEEPMTMSDTTVTPPVAEVSLRREGDAKVGVRDKYELTITVPPGVSTGIYEDEAALQVSTSVKHPRFERFNFSIVFRAMPD